MLYPYLVPLPLTFERVSPHLWFGKLSRSLSAKASSRHLGSEGYPIVIARGSGSSVWDTEGREYLDFAACNSPLGHSHPGLTVSLAAQAAALASAPIGWRARPCEEAALVIAEYFGYARALLFGSHAGAGVAARYIARSILPDAKTGDILSGSPSLLLARSQNLSADTLTATKMMIGDCGFGSRSMAAQELEHLLQQGLSSVEAIYFDDLDTLEKAVSRKAIWAFQVEPVQIDAGVVLARDAYMRKVVDICRKRNVPVIADERRTGLGRTGRPLFCDHDGGVKPDMVLLGSALTGDILPSSCLLLSKDVVDMMDDRDIHVPLSSVVSPLVSSVVMATFDAFRTNNLCEKSEKLGADFRKRLRRNVGQNSMLRVGSVRGRGLLNALVVGERHDSLAQQVCLVMAQEGILAISEQNVIFLTPPLVTTEDELKMTVSIINKSVRHVLGSKEAVKRANAVEPAACRLSAELEH